TAFADADRPRPRRGDGLPPTANRCLGRWADPRQSRPAGHRQEGDRGEAADQRSRQSNGASGLCQPFLHRARSGDRRIDRHERSDVAMGWRRSAVAALALIIAVPARAQAPEIALPVLVPLTGFVALEGTSQRNGALLAMSQIRDVRLKPDVLDTAATPEAAVNAWTRAVGEPPPVAVIGPILGTQMLALLPLAEE